MSVIQQQSNATLTDAWRTLQIDHLDPDSPHNFPLSTLHPTLGGPAPSLEQVRQLGGQIRQLLRGGDAEGALRTALENPPYGADDATRDEHAKTVLEVLSGMRASEIPAVLKALMAAGGEEVDVLVKYLYKGMSASTGGSLTTSVSSLSRSTGGHSRLTPQSTGGFSQIGGGRPTGASESSGSAMSVLLSWHEKVVEVAGFGCIARCLSDWRRV